MAADISFKVSADLAEIRTALQGLRADFQQAGRSASTALGTADTSALVGEFAHLRAELGQLRAEYQRAGAEARTALSNLGTSQAANDMAELRATIAGVATALSSALNSGTQRLAVQIGEAVTQAIDLRAEFTGVAKEAEAASKKVKSSLEDAFSVLRIRPGAEIRADIERVAAALEKVRKSGAGTAEIARASEAARRQIASLNAELANTQTAISRVGGGASGISDAFRTLNIRGPAEVNRELLAVQSALERVRASANSPQEIERYTRAAAARTAELKNELRGVDVAGKSAASSLGGLGRALSGVVGATVGALGVREVINLADTYTSMTARLRLATKATGDFEQVQEQLRRTATETRAPLQDTVNLYSQVAPSLQRILNSQEIVGVITTVNQAIALSGSSATASSAALVQFTQGLASGTLRGEELNSILEQTPALADAIAEGLGVTRGELRKLGEEGALTAERVVGALQKVSGRVASDFKDVPVTVAQAFVLLNNSILQFVGTLDQSTGSTSALANAIISVGAGIDDLSASKETLKAFTDVLINGFDLGARVFQVFGTAIAGAAAMIERLLNFDLKGAFDTWKATMEDIGEIASKPIASSRIDQQKPQRDANARLEIERKLANEVEKLERLKAVAAGEASADILKGEKELATERNKVAEQAMKDRLKAEESTAEKLRDLYAKSLTDAQKARDEAGKIRTNAGNEATDLRDRAAERRGRGLSESDREDLNRRNASNLTSQATLTAGRAQAAARDGDLKKAEKLSADAAKLAERAQRAADSLKDDDDAARALEELARVQEKIGEAQAKTKEGEAAQLEKEAAATDQQIKQAEERIAAVKAELAKPITLQADIAEAEKSIKTLEERLAALPDKTVTVTVQTVNAPGTPADAAAVASIPALATGGKLTGPGSDRSDNLLLWGSPGEWMVNARASRYYGDEFMARLNSMQLPRFADGGPISPGMRSAAGDSEAAVLATLNFPGMSPVQARISRATHDVLARELRREARKAGR